LYSAPKSINGKVVAVLDGDTIEVLSQKTLYRIRILGIDAPEKKQAFGNQAKSFASKHAFGKMVKVQIQSQDRYQRHLAQIILPNGQNLGEMLVKNGYAWHYKQYSKDKSLARLQVEAQKAKRGLWQDANPVPPWEFRKSRRRS